MDLRDQIKQELTKKQKDKGFGDTFERIMIFTGMILLVILGRNVLIFPLKQELLAPNFRMETRAMF